MNSITRKIGIYKNFQQIRHTSMATSQAQIKKINDMWVKGERNKASIMRAVGVSRKTLLKYLKQTVQQTIPSECTRTAQEVKPIYAHQTTPVQAPQSPEHSTYETYYPRKLTWEEIEEYTRPDPVTERVFDYRFDNLGPPPWEQEQQMQPLYYQYPEEDFQQDPQYNRIKDELTWIEEKINKLKEEDRRESEEIFRDRNTWQPQVNNEQIETRNLPLQQHEVESDPDKAIPVIEEDKPIRSSVDSISPNPEETNNQNIPTSFTPATKINLLKSDEKHPAADTNSEEAIPTIEKENKKWEEPVKKTASKDDHKSTIATSKNDTFNLQDRQNAEVTSAVALEKTVPMEKKEEKEQGYFEIQTEPLFTFLVDSSTRFIRSYWDNKQIKTQPMKQRENENLSDYQNISNHKPIILQPVKKEDNKKRDHQKNS